MNLIEANVRIRELDPNGRIRQHGGRYRTYTLADLTFLAPPDKVEENRPMSEWTLATRESTEATEERTRNRVKAQADAIKNAVSGEALISEDPTIVGALEKFYNWHLRSDRHAILRERHLRGESLDVPVPELQRDIDARERTAHDKRYLLGVQAEAQMRHLRQILKDSGLDNLSQVRKALKRR
jgi:hypothetical protein